MSSWLGSPPAEKEERQSVSRSVGVSQGQRHDRIWDSDQEDARIQESAGEVQTTLMQKMVSAISGSVLTSLLVTPLDVVRVRLQSQPSPRPSSQFRNVATSSSFSNLPPNLGISACCREVFWVNNNAEFCIAGSGTLAANNNSISAAAADCAVEETQRKHFTSTLDGLRKIARNEGILTLWRGLSPTLLMAVPGNVIYFAGYDWLRTSRRSPVYHRVSDDYAPLVAGSAARVLAAFAVSPLEMFRTRMQAAHSASPTWIFRETLRGLYDLTQTQGYRSLWRGLSLTLWRDVPFSAIYWWGYEATKNALTDARERALGREVRLSENPRLHRKRSQAKQSHASILRDSFIAGAVAGSVASIVTTPFDVGKTRQQVFMYANEPASKTTSGHSHNYLRPEERSMPRFLWHILKHEGPSGLFKGWAARVLKVAPACGIMISSYELGKKMAHELNEKKMALGEQ